jgi:hypothetical protein
LFCIQVIALMLENHDKLKYVTCDLNPPDNLSVNLETANTSLENIEESTHNEDVPSLSTNDDITHNTSETNNIIDTSSSHKIVPSEFSSNGQHQSQIKVMSNHSATEQIDYKPGLDQSKLILDPTCLDCQRQFREPRPEELVMYLHALKYEVHVYVLL